MGVTKAHGIPNLVWPGYFHKNLVDYAYAIKMDPLAVVCTHLISHAMKEKCVYPVFLGLPKKTSCGLTNYQAPPPPPFLQ